MREHPARLGPWVLLLLAQGLSVPPEAVRAEDPGRLGAENEQLLATVKELERQNAALVRSALLQRPLELHDLQHPAFVSVLGLALLLAVALYGSSYFLVDDSPTLEEFVPSLVHGDRLYGPARDDYAGAAGFHAQDVHLFPQGGVDRIASAEYVQKHLEENQFPVLPGVLPTVLSVSLLPKLGTLALNSYSLLVVNFLRLSKLEQDTHLDVPHAGMIMVPFFEFFGVAVFLLQILYSWLMFLCNDPEASEKGRFDKWYHLYAVGALLESLSRFSAISVLGSVTPFFLSRDLAETLAELPESRGKGIHVALFGLKKLLVAAFGVVAFAGKVEATARDMTEIPFGETKRNSLHAIVAAGLFLLQALGMMDMKKRLMDRVSLFVFAGGDAAYNRDELIFASVYRARVAELVWTHLGRTVSSVYAFAALLAFDDLAMQRLAVGESAAPAELAALGRDARTMARV